MDLETLKNNVSFFKTANHIKRLTKGFSPDHKYIVSDQNGIKYLFRTADLEHFERKKLEFEIMKDIEKLRVRSPKTYEIGKIKDLGICYYILSYIEGEDARDKLPEYSAEIQYKIGLEAGRDLAKMNTYPAPSLILEWSEHIYKKYNRYLEAYKTCGIKLRNDEKIIHFIEENKHYLMGRPNCFQHDDFHVGNIIVIDENYAGVIDFNRFDWGDPIFDFVKVALFSREISIPFSIGQINGYYEGEIPENFWRLYSIYVAMSIFACVVWSKDYTPELLDEMLNRLYMVLEDHRYFEYTEPQWFKDGIGITQEVQ
ncbi:aminoglycoside phosphotransferase family protein [Litchfieldia alkalitelluris]|uniref:aminoglycoside phosphotransferase family protein n=1 Tax=Litchfieldia alkalitelluris TaxID=304268 RepID=UPI000998E4D9|nr:aminoglycoside phosphotransferase family protein [Litchfieldia alkalitelluris]